ncbi:hypothetical protein E2C01_039572 [Portunus trituberculatus]|uniref:Uncharacterized protein n=1 Tax=Portunus trituberculatus TaxID=210409 RepID=A0A5B7FK45_PORTR|nr:hypothetical protein [Portunus trituberculatus]
MSPFISFFHKVMHIMCCNNFIIQCILLLHRSVWKTVFSNIHNILIFTCPLVLLSSVTSTR